MKVILKMEKLFIFSDSHDNLVKIRKMIDTIKTLDIDKIIFCGDLVSPFVARLLAKEIPNNITFIGVFGNNDGDKITIKRMFSSRSNFFIGDFPHIMKLNEKYVVLFHGWGSPEKTKNIVYATAKDKKFLITIYGHTHIPDLISIDKDYRLTPLLKNWDVLNKVGFRIDLNRERIILNPGELGTWVTGKSSAVYMIIDDNLEAKINFIPIK